MTPAFPDGTTWPYSPPPEKARPDLGGNGDPGTYEADAAYNDPETLRLAKVVHSADWGTPVEECHAGADDYRIAAAVLADLRERYILIPLDEADTEWVGNHGLFLGRPRRSREAALSEGGRIMRRTVGPWEPTP